MTKALLICLWSLFYCDVALAPFSLNSVRTFLRIRKSNVDKRLLAVFASYEFGLQPFILRGPPDHTVPTHLLYIILKNADMHSLAVPVMKNSCIFQAGDVTKENKKDVFDNLAIFGDEALSSWDYKQKLLDAEDQFLDELRPTFHRISKKTGRGVAMVLYDNFVNLIANLAPLIEVDGYPKVGNPNIYWSHFSQKGITLPVLLEVFRAISIQTPRSLNDIIALASSVPLITSFDLSDKVLNKRLLSIYQSYITVGQANDSFNLTKARNQSILRNAVIQIFLNSGLANRSSLETIYERTDGTTEFEKFLDIFQSLVSFGDRSMTVRDYKIDLLDCEAKFIKKLGLAFHKISEREMGVDTVGRESFENLIRDLAPSSKSTGSSKISKPSKYWNQYSRYTRNPNGFTLDQLFEVFRAISVETPISLNDILELSLTLPSGPYLNMSDATLNKKLMVLYRNYIKAVQVNSFFDVKSMKKDVMHKSTALQVISNSALASAEDMEQAHAQVLHIGTDVFVLDAGGLKSDTVEFENFLKMFNVLEEHQENAMTARDYKVKVLEYEAQFVKKVTPIFNTLAGERMHRSTFKHLIGHLDLSIHPESRYHSEALGRYYAEMYFNQYSPSGEGLAAAGLLEAFRALSIWTREPLGYILDRASFVPRESGSCVPKETMVEVGRTSIPRSKASASTTAAYRQVS